MIVFPGLGRSDFVPIQLNFGSLELETRTVPRASQAICHSETEAFLLGSDIGVTWKPFLRLANEGVQQPSLCSQVMSSLQ